jgi:hypothetical protein
VLKHGLGPYGRVLKNAVFAFQGTSRKRPSPSFSSGVSTESRELFVANLMTKYVIQSAEVESPQALVG